MAATKLKHWLKYYKEIQSQGHTWRLEILQWASRKLVQVEIGSVLQGLRLYVQGDQSDIDTPIVKTSLEMTFVDAPDLEADRKCGNWDVFYTSSATEYKVKLYKDGVVEWTGYITPDSYSEDLMYRGSVTIIARDNLGALQDFEFDAAGDEDGMITLYDLVHTGLERVSFAMEVYDDHSAASVFPLCVDADSPILYKVKFNVSSFREKSWQEAIEDAMYSCGVVLRYIGENQFFFCPLRAVPLMGKDMWCRVATKDVRFASYGHRELSPAVKSIVDEVGFEIQDNLVSAYMPESCYGDVTEYQYGSIYASKYTMMPVYDTIGGLFRVLNPSNETSLLLNPFAYPLNKEHYYGKGGDIQDPNVLYLAANKRSGTNMRAGFRIKLPAGKYKIGFQVNKMVALYDDKTTIGYYKKFFEDDNTWTCYYEAQFVGDDGSYQTLSGSTVKQPEWLQYNATASLSFGGRIDLPYTHESPELITEVAGVLTFKFHDANLPINLMDDRVCDGAYLGIKDFAINTIDNAGKDIIDHSRVETRYNTSNNIILSRSPEYGVNVSDLISPKQVVNGVYISKSGEYEGSQQWRFYEGQTPNPLPVLIHQQLLAYYSKPNNILTGELVVDDADFRSLYLWKGKKHLLTAGALNILTGHIEGATLREFKRYSELWETDAETDYVEFRIGGGTQTIALTSNKELTSADVHIDDTWCSATIESTGSQAYSLTINAGYNTTGEARVAFITIDTFTIMVRQIAHLIID